MGATDASSRPDIKTVRKELTAFVDGISPIFSTDSVIEELMERRHYNTQGMWDTLKQVGVFMIDHASDLSAVSSASEDQLRLWGILSEDGTCLLEHRFVVPIRAINGDVIALVGWYPDRRKYITTPTYGFVRETAFFNMETYADCVSRNNGVLFLLEGIFDTLSVRSLGLSAWGNMGLPLSIYKREVLKRVQKVVCISDNDRAGRSAIPFYNRVSGKTRKNVWAVYNPHVHVLLPTGVKDIDDLIKGYECIDDLNAAIQTDLLYQITT